MHLGEDFPLRGAVMPVLMEGIVELRLTIAFMYEIWLPGFRAQPFNCHSASPGSLPEPLYSTFLDARSAAPPVRHAVSNGKRKGSGKAAGKKRGEAGSAMLLGEKSKGTVHTWRGHSHCPWWKVTVQIKMLHEVPSPRDPVNGIAEVSLRQGFLLAAEPAQQRWPPTLLILTPLASRRSQNSFPEMQPRINQLNSG